MSATQEKNNYNMRLLASINALESARKAIETKGDRSKEPGLKALSDAFDKYYFINKLKIYCAYLSYSSIMNSQSMGYSKSDIALINEIIITIQTNEVEDPVLLIYNNIRVLFENISHPDDNTDLVFIEIEEQIKSSSSLLSNEEVIEVYSFLSNYAIKRMNQGNTLFRQRFLLANNHIVNIIYSDKATRRQKLPSSIYENMVIVALNIDDEAFFNGITTVGIEPESKADGFAGKFEWAEKFIQSYKGHLDESGVKSHFPYCLGLLEFSRGRFEPAFSVLEAAKPRGMFIGLNVKLLLLKTIYELRKNSKIKYQKIDIEARLETYRILLLDEKKRKQKLGYQIQYYESFERLFRTLYHTLTLSSKYFGSDRNQYTEQKGVFKNQIEKCPYSYKSWFMEKLLELK